MHSLIYFAEAIFVNFRKVQEITAVITLVVIIVAIIMILQHTNKQNLKAFLAL